VVVAVALVTIELLETVAQVVAAVAVAMATATELVTQLD
jgi:hypothetical protein